MQNFISIPKPCNENWNSMTPQEQGRHCAKCNIVVKDFSLMSNEEILSYLNKNTGRTCAQISTDQLAKPAIQSKKLRQFMYAFALIFLPFVPIVSLGQSNNDSAENIVKKEQGSVKGRIVDEKGEAVPFALVIVSDNNKEIGYSKSDYEGHFRIDSLPIGNYKLGVRSVGYETLELLNVAIRNKRTTIHNITIEKKACKLKGIVIQTRPPIVDPETPNKQEISGQEIRDMMGGG